MESQDKNKEAQNLKQDSAGQEKMKQPMITPFSKTAPTNRWQGKTCSILQTSENGLLSSIYFDLNEPVSFTSLTLQSQNRSESIFFNPVSNKYLRIASDCLSWSYYMNGPFQRIESGAWLPIKTVRPGEKAETFEVEDKDGKIYVYDNGTGLVVETRSSNEEEEEKKITESKESTGAGGFDFEALKKKYKVNPKHAEANKETRKETEKILKKLNGNKDMEAFRQAVIDKSDGELPEIKSSKVVEAFEEVLSLYDCDAEYSRNNESINECTCFALENMNQARFVMGIILPELYLYPKEVIKTIDLKKIVFCGDISSKEYQKLGFVKEGSKLKISCSQKNIVNIQKSLHEGIACFIACEVQTMGDFSFSSAWENLNPPDFSYDIKRTKVPKGLSGFIGFRSTRNYMYDWEEIHFALMKNPPTILNHSDIIIAKKAHLWKKLLEALYPSSINEEWWNFVTDYKDLIELSLNSTEYFKEAHFEEDQIEKTE